MVKVRDDFGKGAVVLGTVAGGLTVLVGLEKLRRHLEMKETQLASAHERLSEEQKFTTGLQAQLKHQGENLKREVSARHSERARVGALTNRLQQELNAKDQALKGIHSETEAVKALQIELNRKEQLMAARRLINEQTKKRFNEELKEQRLQKSKAKLRAAFEKLKTARLQDFVRKSSSNMLAEKQQAQKKRNKARNEQTQARQKANKARQELERIRETASRESRASNAGITPAMQLLRNASTRS
jgi:chromosome segregation ATPase